MSDNSNETASSKRDGTIEQCVLTLEEGEATALRDVLTEWLG